MGIEQSLIEIQLNHYRMVVRNTTLSNAITSLKKKLWLTQLTISQESTISKLKITQQWSFDREGMGMVVFFSTEQNFLKI